MRVLRLDADVHAIAGLQVGGVPARPIGLRSTGPSALSVRR